MRISALETVRIRERPNLLWLRVLTDEGVTGLGETFFGAGAVEAHVHEWIAPRVLGRDPLAIDALSRDLAGYLGFRSSGAETRGNSAFDIALWDLWGRATDQPVAQLLGGFTRGSIRAYNTCAGADYIKRPRGRPRRTGARAVGATSTTSTPSSAAPTSSPTPSWRRASRP